MTTKFSIALVLIGSLLFMLSPLSHATRAFDLSDELKQKSKEVGERHNYFIKKIGDADSEGEVLSFIKEMIQDANELLDLSELLSATCSYDSVSYSSSSFSWCFDYVRLYNTEAGNYSVNIAIIAAKHGHLELAKKLYRNIITTYVGDAFRSIVKKAEFGLNDIDSKQQESQPSKKEIDYLKRENDLLKREIELLKNENKTLKTQLRSTKD